MAKAYIAPRRKMMRSRKYNGKCEHCGTPKPLSEVYCYVDDVNPAINYNAPYLCIDCYREKYGKGYLMFDHRTDEQINLYIYLVSPQTLHNAKKVKEWSDHAQRDISRLQEVIGQLKGYQSALAERAILLLDAEINTAYTRVLTIERDKSYCSKRVTYTVAITRRYNDKSIKEQDELREEYPGNERHKALARFAELQKLHPGIETEKHLEKARWE